MDSGGNPGQRMRGSAGQLPAARLLDREAEHETLQALIREVPSAGGRLLLIEGEAGIGKSALLTTVRQLSLDAGYRVGIARAGQREEGFAFGVTRQLLEPIVALEQRNTGAMLFDGAAALSRPLFDAVGVARGEPAAEGPFPMLHGLYWLTANLSHERPLALAVDDAHWADEESLHFISYLAHRIEGVPLLVAMTTRPQRAVSQRGVISDLIVDPATVVVRPRPLSATTVATLLREEVGEEPGRRFTAACHLASGGNPLFLRGLTRAIVMAEIAPTDQNAAMIPELRPDDVARTLDSTLRRLPPEATDVAHALAVLGDGASVDAIGDVVGLALPIVGEMLDALAAADIVSGDDTPAFVHPVLRTAAYDQVARHERSRLHARAAEALGRRGAYEPAANQLVMASPPIGPSGVQVLRDSAQQALRRGAPQAAAGYLRRVLAEPVEVEERADLLRLLGTAELSVDTFAAVEHLAASLEVVSDPVRRAETAILYLRGLEYVDRFEDAATAIREALGALGERHTEIQRLLQALELDCTLWEPKLTDRGRELLAELGPDGLDGHDLGSAAMNGVLAFHEARLGASRRRAVELARRALAHAGLLQQPSGVISGLSAAFALTLADELAEAARVYEEALGEARGRGDIVNMVPLLLLRGMVALRVGDLRRAEELLRAPEIELAHSASTTAGYRVGFLVDVLLERDAISEAEAVLSSVRSEDQVHAGYRPFYIHARASLALATDDVHRAIAEWESLRTYTQSIGIANPAYVPWRSAMALALHRLGEGPRALTLAGEEVELARRWGAPRALGIALVRRGLITGRDGVDDLHEAVAVLEVSPARLEHARAVVSLGSALRRQNRRTDAAEHLRKGLDAAHRLGAARLVRHAKEELAAIGMRPRRPSWSGVDALTPSERRVARMAAEGLSNREIAQALFVTVKAVETHLTNVYQKLEIRSRIQLPEALSDLSTA